MSESSMTVVAPILPVAELKRAIDFYRAVLGFDVAWIAGGEPPRIASICRDDIYMMMRNDSAARNSEIYITLTGIDACYERAVAAGAKVLEPIADRQYGMRDFAIEDPDGNRISLGEELAKK